MYSAYPPGLCESKPKSGGFFVLTGYWMKYVKPHLSYDQQADLLISRGMKADRSLLIKTLKSVSYYRLSGYWFPFRESETSNNFKSNTSFDIIWERYIFDRRLRILLMDAIERIEIAIRSDIVYYFTKEHGPFGYLNKEKFPNLNADDYDSLLKKNIF